MSGNYWQLSSELGKYPVLSKSNNLMIYTFYSSAGVSNTTPQGNYGHKLKQQHRIFIIQEKEWELTML